MPSKWSSTPNPAWNYSRSPISVWGTSDSRMGMKWHSFIWIHAIGLQNNKTEVYWGHFLVVQFKNHKKAQYKELRRGCSGEGIHLNVSRTLRWRCDFLLEEKKGPLGEPNQNCTCFCLRVKDTHVSLLLNVRMLMLVSFHTYLSSMHSANGGFCLTGCYWFSTCWEQITGWVDRRGKCNR